MPENTKYEVCKQALENNTVQPMLAIEVIQHLNDIGKWVIDMATEKYFMLLNREAYDFTVFNVVDGDTVKIGEEIQEVLESRGEIVFVEYSEEQQAYEIWVKCNDWMKMRTRSNYVMFMFFSCDSWVIEV